MTSLSLNFFPKFVLLLPGQETSRSRGFLVKRLHSQEVSLSRGFSVKRLPGQEASRSRGLPVKRLPGHETSQTRDPGQEKEFDDEVFRNFFDMVLSLKIFPKISIVLSFNFSRKILIVLSLNFQEKKSQEKDFDNECFIWSCPLNFLPKISIVLSFNFSKKNLIFLSLNFQEKRVKRKILIMNFFRILFYIVLSLRFSPKNFDSPVL